MNPLFSAGWPRPGQWVILDVNGQKRIGVNNAPGRFDPPELLKYFSDNPSKVRIDLVELEGQQAGLKTSASLIVDVMDCAPLLDKTRIPAPRLRTMDPNWTPVA